LCRCALEQPAATHCEQSVADKGYPGIGKMIGDVPGGMGRDVDDGCRSRTKINPIAAAHMLVERRYTFRLGGGAGYDATCRRFNRRIAAGVIGVPMGVPDMGDFPAQLVCFGQHRFGHRGVDYHHFAAVTFTGQPDVIVG
jgi:hypothetical protein